jgi:hypothetical protein
MNEIDQINQNTEVKGSSEIFRRLENKGGSDAG